MNQCLLVLLSALSLCANPAKAEDCAKQGALVRKSLDENRLDAVQSPLAAMETACPENILNSAKIYYTEVVARQANELVNQNRLDEASALLNQAKTLSWMVSSVRGDIAAKRKNWKEAAQQYGQAFDLITDPKQVSPEDMIKLREIQQQLYQLATDAQLVYGKLDASIARGDQPQGILLAQTRNFGVKQAALPVHFDTNKASLNADGMESVEKLAAFIQGRSQAKKLILTGFADPRGSAEHNRILSKNRAQTVADYLKQHHVNLPIETVGKGEGEPPNTVLENLTEQEQLARWRRVELEIVNN